MEEDVRERITMTRLRLVDRFPFFGYLLMQVNIRESSTITETAATDGVRIYYNKNFLETLSDRELEFVLSHEVMHCVLNHITRKGDRNPVKWNFAIDYATNLLLQESGVGTPPPGVLLDEKYKDMSAEEIYEQLEVHEIPVCTCGRSDGKATGDRRECPRCGGSFDQHDYDAVRGKETEVESRWRSVVEEAANTARQRGNLPAGIQRLVKDLLQPQLPWQILLSRYLNSLMKGDYKWIPPNKRYVWQNIYLPRIYDQYALKVVVALDTSGSISENELTYFVSEVTGILRCTFEYTLWVIACDAEVQEVQRLRKGDPVSKIRVSGGGGTRFEPVFDYVKEHRLDPDVLVYFTDLCGSFPEEKPPYPVIWIALERDVGVPFGTVYPYNLNK